MPHESNYPGRAGSVTLWHPFTGEAADAAGEEEAGEEGWVSDTVRRYAARLARQIREWLENPFWVESKGRPLRPEDILILVRRRGDLASLLVARLHAENVPVAGVDRLLLSAPLAVQDLLAAARFALQPLDDLNLASLLVSPLFGWSQDELFEAAFGREGPLWPHLRARTTRPDTMEGLHSLLAMADFATPHSFFETILSGPLQGRRKLLERLGAEARDPIGELQASALEFETAGTPSLEGFLDWFARGDVEIVRDPSAPLDAVRVMTVHGSKGLQSPVLILADACADPARKGGGLRGSFAELTLPDGGPTIPVIRPRKDELAEPLKSQIEAKDRLEREEHWRLLYVALTRAEERLYIGGALGAADRNGPPEESWYTAVAKALSGLGCEWGEERLWTRSCRHGPAEVPSKAQRKQDESSVSLPEWLKRAAPAEPRPPRPLVPSAAPEDETPDPPPGREARQAALRGKLLHQLFERLPSVAEADRAAVANRWLERAAGVADAGFRDALIDDACRIIGDPRFADLFGPAALAEAPIAAVVPGGQVVTGTVDRLLVTGERVLVVDFKTGRNVPGRPEEVPPAHLRQMAAYVAALRVIFPDRPVEAALLYTAGPRLHLLPAA
jgi:ATP-dependent helicase/nuclease subunit A